MTIGTKDLRPTELDNFEDGRLTDELKKAKEELFNLRFQIATGTLESHGRVRAVKRDIARIYTVLRERELGIRATPAPVEVPAKAAPKKRTRKAAETSDVAEAPAAEEAGAVETSAVETSAVETSAVETPAVETSAVETSAVEEPVAATTEEAPAAEAAAPKTPRKRAVKKEGE